MTAEDAVVRNPTAGRRTSGNAEARRLRTVLVRGAADPPREFMRRIPLRGTDGIVLLPVTRIVLIVAKRERLVVTTTEQTDHLLWYRLKDLEARLDPAEFVRLNRSMIVNINAVARIAPESGGTNKVVLNNGKILRMSRNQAARLRRVLMDLLG